MDKTERLGKLVSIEVILQRILVLRRHRVILDQDLARLYNVETKALTRAVKRNQERFPHDFMFQLTAEEFKDLRRHFGASSWGGRRYLPLAFTEQGVAMLSSVLHSRRAILVNVEIMRTFVCLRQVLATHKDLARKVKELERLFAGKYEEHEEKFKEVFETLYALMAPTPQAKRRAGFRQTP